MREARFLPLRLLFCAALAALALCGVAAQPAAPTRAETQLVVSANPNQPILWTRRAIVAAETADATVSVAGATYNRESMMEGSGEVIGASGSASNQSVRLSRYRAASGAETLFVFEWESGSLALAGVEIDPGSLEIFSREQ